MLPTKFHGKTTRIRKRETEKERQKRFRETHSELPPPRIPLWVK